MANPAKDARDKMQAEWPGASVSARGRKSITHQHPTEPGRFALDTSIGPLHYGISEDQEIDTAWVASASTWDYEAVENDFECYVRDSVPVSYRYVDKATGHFVEITFNAIEWVNDEGQTENAASFSQVTPDLNDDELVWSNIAPGWSVLVRAETARLAKWLTINSLADLGAPTIGGTNPALQMSLTYQRSNGLEIWADGQQWDEGNNSWLETVNNIEFRGEIGQQVIFSFKHPVGKDGDEFERSAPPMSHRVARRGNNFYAEIKTPWSWLSTAIFPVTLDDTVDYQVGASSDDAGQIGLTMDITGVDHQADAAGEYLGWRWTGVTIPDGATIDLATLDLNFVNENNDEPLGTFYGDDTSTPATFTTTDNDISDRTDTTASVAWDVADLGMGTGTWLSSQSQEVTITGIISELQASYDYSSGLALALQFAASGPATRDCRVNTYDGSTAWGAKLHIEYTAVSTGPQINISPDANYIQIV